MPLCTAISGLILAALVQGTVMVYSIRTHETLSPQGLLLLLLPLELLVLLGLLLLLRQHMQKGSFIPSHV